MTLLACWLVTPGVAQIKATDGTGNGGYTLFQVPDTQDKDAAVASFSVQAINGESSSSRLADVAATVNDSKYILRYGTTSGILDSHLADQAKVGMYAGMSGRQPTISSLGKGPVAMNPKANGAAFDSPAGDGDTAAVTDVRAAGDADAPGSSRYIVVFGDDSPMALKAAKEQVKDFAESHDGEIVHDYSIISGLAVSIPEDKAAALSSLDNVKYVEKDQLACADLDQSVPQIGANLVQDLGYDGTGVKVCVIDTGIDVSHPDLNNGKVVQWVDYVHGLGTPYDDNGHGTHVSSIIAGTGNASGGLYKGVAPGASLMGAKVMDSSGTGRYSDIIAAISWAVANHAQVISMSLGGQHSHALDDAVNGAISQGVVVVVSAGNSGPDVRTISCPGDIADAITVGAVDHNDVIAYFSSRGPSINGDFKPDVTAPGVGIVAARASGTGTPLSGNSYYTVLSGTSMAAPMVTGTVALLLDKNASLKPAQVKDALTKTAKPLGYGIPNNDYGYGRVQAKVAIDYVTNGSAMPSPTPSPTPVPGSNGVPAVAWDNAYQGYAYDVGAALQPTSDGGFIATGWSYQHGSRDIYLVKTDATGHVLWNRTFGNSWEEQGNAVRQAADGGYIIVGDTWLYGQGSESISLVKTDPAGNIEWNRTYNRNIISEGNDVLQTADGGFIVLGGALVSGPGYIDVYMMKVDSSGNFLWDRTFGGTDYDNGYSVQQTVDGGFVIAGCSYIVSNDTLDAFLIKTDSLGHQLWNKTYGPKNADYTYGFSVLLTADGGFVVAGTATFSTDSHVYVLKTDSSGNKQWDRIYNASDGADAYGGEIQKVATGGYVIVGSTQPHSGYSSVLLLKIDDLGEPLWQKEPGVDTYATGGSSIVPTADGGFIVCGSKGGFTGDLFGSDLYILKTNASGVVQWDNAYGERSTDTCTWAQPTSDGGYILTGATDFRNMGYDMSLIKVDASGREVWRNAYGENDDDFGSMVLQTPDGGYVVAGSMQDYSTGYAEASLIKASSTGDWLQQNVYGNSSDSWANALSPANDGGYVLAGGKYDPGPLYGDCDAYLVKTNASGGEQWEYRYGGIKDDWANSVLQTVDGGYLLVGGTYSDGTGNCDVYVKKVSSTGASQWGYYYYTDSSVWGNSVLPTADGGYIITGGARYNQSETKIVLLKIDGSGQIQWYHYYGDASYQEGLSIRPAVDGSYLIGGTNYDDFNKTYRMVLMKIDTIGNPLWTGAYGQNGSSYGYYAQQTADGGYILAGTTFFENNTQANLIKMGGVTAPQGHKPIQQINAPPMVPGYQTKGGITGRVTTFDTTNGIANADLWIVNASNTSQYYWHVTTNAQGYYQLTDVNNTWDGSTYQPRYRAYAYESQFGECYSYNFTVEAGSNAWAAVIMVTSSSPMPAQPYPAQIVQVVPAPAMQGSQEAGAVTGRVTTLSTTQGVANAFVAIVNASNTSQAFYVGLTDAQGYFRFAGVNHTFDGTTGTYLPKYKAYANSSVLGNGWSNNFTVEPMFAGWAAVIVNPVPAHVTVSCNRSNIVANSSDRARISAYVTDATGAVVADNTPISFNINPGITYSTGMGNFTGSAGNTTTVGTVGGYANVTYGWVDGAYAGNSTLITASYNNNRNVNATVCLPLLAASSPLPSHGPIQQVSPYNMTTTAGLNAAGAITGRVTTLNTGIGIANTDVWIVNASNFSQYFWHTTTNSQGYFQLTDINNTYVDAGWFAANPGRGAPFGYTVPGYYTLYQAYCYDNTFGESWSNNFSVEAGSNAWAAIIINPVPAHITINANRTSLVADGRDTITVSAYVTDAMSNPVAPNSPITFTINKGLAYTGGMGSWSGFTGNSTTVGTNNSGYATLTFGTVPAVSAGNNSILTAESAYVPAIKDNIGIYCQPATVPGQRSYTIDITGDPGTKSTTGEIVLTRCQLKAYSGAVMITAQLRDNGSLLNRAGVSVTFSSDNATIGWLPNVKTNLTSVNGDSKIVLNMGSAIGSVNVTARAVVDGVSLQDMVKITVVPAVIIVDKAGGPGIETSINAAIANAFAGDEIIVHSGTYPESVNVNKQLTLTGVDTGAGLPLIDGGGNWGIYITTSDSVVQNFNVTDTSDGILILGQMGTNVKNNTICNNTISRAFNEYIDVESSNDNNIFNNVIIGYPDYTTECGIRLLTSDNDYVRGNDISGIKGSGISIFGSDSQISGNNLHGNNFGISGSGSNNTISGNLLYETVYDNAFSIGPGNNWNSTTRVDYYYNGSRYYNFTGNYWGDYTGSDNNSDGIGDSPYLVNGVTDYYPLMGKNLTIVPAMTFDLVLQQGWNLVSIPLTPLDNNITRVIPPEAMANIQIIWNYDNANPGAPVWKFYKPGRAVNTLFNITDGMGFWVLANSAIDITVRGTMPQMNNATFNKGWNMVGPEGFSTYTPADQYSAYYLTWGYKNGQWSYYKPSKTVNTLAEIKPGSGYWVLVT